MITPLTPAEVIAAIGRTARDAARSAAPLGEFERGQLMSAYSGSRHLAVELESFGPEVERFCARVATAIEASELAEARPAAAALRETADPRRAGEVVCGLLNLLHAHPAPAAAGLRGEVHTSLRELCDREVDLLADAIERR
jgi:hypothetical protein